MVASRFVAALAVSAVVLVACGEGPAAEVRSRPGGISDPPATVSDVGSVTQPPATTPSSTNPGVVVTTTPTLPPVDPSTLGAECTDGADGAAITAVGVEGTFDVTLQGSDCTAPVAYDTFLTVFRARDVNCPAVRYLASRMASGSKEAGFATMAATAVGCVDDATPIDFDLPGWEHPTSLCTIYGTAGPDVIEGTNEKDTICTGAGDDIVNALDGGDSIQLGAGNNVVDAGPGNDSVRVDQGDADAPAGNNTITMGPGIDFVTAGPGDDFIDLGEGGDNADGGAGDDVIIGGPGRDIFDGGEGNDILIGADSQRNGGGFGDLVEGDEGVDLAILIDTNAGEFYGVGRDVEAPVEFCVFEVDLVDDGEGNRQGTLRCPLLEEPILMTVDGFEVSYQSAELEPLLGLDLDRLRALAAMVADVDICICEPPVYSGGISNRKIVGDDPADELFPDA